jgi:[acyl-carrier-protein] S-malonyltransferase
MRSATEKMREVIIKEEFKKPEINIISNVTAQQTNDPKDIKKLLIDQIERPVRWREIVINMIDSKVEKFIEIGPGKVLSGLVKRINSNVKLIQVNDFEDLNNLN